MLFGCDQIMFGGQETMKMLKKLTALLLAGVMAMALLTACGGEAAAPGKSAAEQAEDAMMVAMNGVLGGAYKNDEAMKNVARKAITDNVAEDGKAKAFIDGDEAEHVVWMIFPADKEGYALGLTAEQVAQLKDPKFAQEYAESMKDSIPKEDLETAKKTIDAMGIGAVTKNGKTYIAVAAKMNPDAFKGAGE